MLDQSFAQQLLDSLTLRSFVEYMLQPSLWITLVGGFCGGWYMRGHFKIERLEQRQQQRPGADHGRADD